MDLGCIGRSCVACFRTALVVFALVFEATFVGLKPSKAKQQSKGGVVYCFLASVVLVGVAYAQSPMVAGLTSTSGAAKSATAEANAAPNVLPNLPSLPSGRSTVIGGTIRKIDPVRDQITISVFGGHDMRVFFDGRTQVYRDGQQVSSRALREGDRASLETLLDGTMVFARSVHVLTQSIEGECQGQVLAFDAARGEVRVRDALLAEPLKLQVPSRTPILHEGQEASSTAILRPGALVKVQFRPDAAGRGVVTSVVIVAVPGDAFVFTGSVAFLDLHAGLLVIVDPRDQQRHEISFDPRSLSVHGLHEGIDVTVSAVFDGTRYAGTAVTINSPSISANAPN